jgi:hypothetical protein
VHQAGYLQGLYRDARSTERKILLWGLDPIHLSHIQPFHEYIMKNQFEYAKSVAWVTFLEIINYHFL